MTFHCAHVGPRNTLLTPYYRAIYYIIIIVALRRRSFTAPPGVAAVANEHLREIIIVRSTIIIICNILQCDNIMCSGAETQRFGNIDNDAYSPV